MHDCYWYCYLSLLEMQLLYLFCYKNLSFIPFLELPFLALYSSIHISLINYCSDRMSDVGRITTIYEAKLERQRSSDKTRKKNLFLSLDFLFRGCSDSYMLHICFNYVKCIEFVQKQDQLTWSKKSFFSLFFILYSGTIFFGSIFT